jgi:uncharacterized protein YndB with AHSA1/START domain
MPSLRLEVKVAATPEQVFAAVVDWPSQGEWMLGTRVWVPEGASGVGVGGRIEAFSGVGRLGFVDTMTITVWDPPHRVEVDHTGSVVKGTGLMVVEPAPDGTAVFVWGEDLELPLGALGRLGWPLVRPFFSAGVRRSLHHFAAYVEAQSGATNAV